MARRRFSELSDFIVVGHVYRVEIDWFGLGIVSYSQGFKGWIADKTRAAEEETIGATGEI
jgi:hypothetical protein